MERAHEPSRAPLRRREYSSEDQERTRSWSRQPNSAGYAGAATRFDTAVAKVFA